MRPRNRKQYSCVEQSLCRLFNHRVRAGRGLIQSAVKQSAGNRTFLPDCEAKTEGLCF